MDNTKEYILCAAVRRKSKRFSTNGSPYWEGTNDICDIEIGYRHHDIYQRFGEEISMKPKDQGFYTSKGRFVDRYEGMKIAYEAGQYTKRVFKKDAPDIEIHCINVLLDNDGYSDSEIKFKDIYLPLFSEDLY